MDEYFFLYIIGILALLILIVAMFKTLFMWATVIVMILIVFAVFCCIVFMPYMIVKNFQK